MNQHGAEHELLYIFRKKAGLPSPGKSLAGWYGGRATTFGQVLGAFAKMYRSTHDDRVRNNALFLVGEWEKCVDADAAVLDNDTYFFDKLLGGLLDAALWGARMIEWYTLPENLYRASELSGDATFAAFAKEWDYRYFWDKLIAKDPTIGPGHAYSHVNLPPGCGRIPQSPLLS